jgi:hypothetical protein
MSLINFVQNSLTGAQPSIATPDINVAAGKTLLAYVLYDVGNDDPVLSEDFGEWEPIPEFERLSQSPRFHGYVIPSATAGEFPVSATFSEDRQSPAIIVFQLEDVPTGFLAGVFPPYNNPGSGADVVTTGPYTVTDAPNYALAFACDLSGDGVAPPNGTTSVFTERGNAWNFGALTPNATIVDYDAIADGDIEATWNSAFGSHTFLTILAMFGVGAPPPAGGGGGRAALLGVGR